MDNQLNEHENGSTETSCDKRSHYQSRENGTKTLAFVPAPLNALGTDSSDTDTCNGGDERIGGRDVSVVSCTPHDPGGCTGRRASKGQELNTCIVFEGRNWDDTVLDGGGSSSTDSEGTGHFENQAKKHSLAVGDGARRDAGRPGVGNIVGTIVVCLEEGKECADGEDVGVFFENWHLGDVRDKQRLWLRRSCQALLGVVRVEELAGQHPLPAIYMQHGGYRVVFGIEKKSIMPRRTPRQLTIEYQCTWASECQKQRCLQVEMGGTAQPPRVEEGPKCHSMEPGCHQLGTGY